MQKVSLWKNCIYYKYLQVCGGLPCISCAVFVRSSNFLLHLPWTHCIDPGPSVGPSPSQHLLIRTMDTSPSWKSNVVLMPAMLCPCELLHCFLSWYSHTSFYWSQNLKYNWRSLWRYREPFAGYIPHAHVHIQANS